MKDNVILSTLVCLIVVSSLLPWILIRHHDEVSGANKTRQISKIHTSQSETAGTPIALRVSVGSNGTNASNNFHFVVSSGCRKYQWWQVLTQIHSARSVGQRGKYSWIVSGCEREKTNGSNIEDELTEVFQSHFISSFQEDMVVSDVHFTPDYANMSVYGGPYADGKRKRTFLNRQGEVQRSGYGNYYHFNNKPNGLRHWAEEHKAELQSRDEAIVLIDPDFLFMTPFTLPVQVSPGKPAGASYGLGGQWIDFNVSEICGAGSPSTRVTLEENRRHYSAGPPYIIHSHDVLKLATVWSKFVPPTYDQYPLLYAEMFAYSMASAHLELKHNLFNGLFTGCMVGWPGTKKGGDAGPSADAFVTAGADIENPVWDGPSSCFLDPFKPPSLLHYCQRYAFETTSGNAAYYFVAKRRVPHDILHCNNPTKYLTPFESNEKERIVGRDQNWTTLTVCTILRSVNFARKSHCDKKGSRGNGQRLARRLWRAEVEN